MNYFESLKQSLDEAVAYKNGDKTKAKRRSVKAADIPAYQSGDIVRVRAQLQLSQHGLATVLGVSSRTVEAWEAGRNVPNMTACRLLYLLEQDNSLIERLTMR